MAKKVKKPKARKSRSTKKLSIKKQPVKSKKRDVAKALASRATPR